MSDTEIPLAPSETPEEAVLSLEINPAARKGHWTVTAWEGETETFSYTGPLHALFSMTESFLDHCKNQLEEVDHEDE